MSIRHAPAGGGYKPFLHGIARSQPRGRVGRLREEQGLSRTLTLEQVRQVVDAQQRLGDWFLFALLFGQGCESGRRWGCATATSSGMSGGSSWCCADIAAAGGSAEATVLDALDERAVDAHVRDVVSRAGSVDVSFNLTSREDSRARR